ncbi:UNVERIFIED_CONTAM: hypothetical protein Slati_2481300, partial [Sesamum latifolium]
MPIICYHCRQPRHISKTCPLRKSDVGGSQYASPSSIGENLQQTSVNRGRGRGGRGSGNISGTSTGQIGQSQPQARVYAITREQAPTALE